MNAKKEFLYTIRGHYVLCARIQFIKDNYEPGNAIDLPLNYTSTQIQNFLSQLDREYDSGFGTQELFGTIWLDSGWFERREYDGSEWWELMQRPEIPIDLMYPATGKEQLP